MREYGKRTVWTEIPLSAKLFSALRRLVVPETGRDSNLYAKNALPQLPPRAQLATSCTKKRKKWSLTLSRSCFSHWICNVFVLTHSMSPAWNTTKFVFCSQLVWERELLWNKTTAAWQNEQGAACGQLRVQERERPPYCGLDLPLSVVLVPTAPVFCKSKSGLRCWIFHEAGILPPPTHVITPLNNDNEFLLPWFKSGTRFLEGLYAILLIQFCKYCPDVIFTSGSHQMGILI